MDQLSLLSPSKTEIIMRERTKSNIKLMVPAMYNILAQLSVIILCKPAGCNTPVGFFIAGPEIIEIIYCCKLSAGGGSEEIILRTN